MHTDEYRLDASQAMPDPCLGRSSPFLRNAGGDRIPSLFAAKDLCQLLDGTDMR